MITMVKQVGGGFIKCTTINIFEFEICEKSGTLVDYLFIFNRTIMTCGSHKKSRKSL